jgi:hypothetical protein
LNSGLEGLLINKPGIDAGFFYRQALAYLFSIFKLPIISFYVENCLNCDCKK